MDCVLLAGFGLSFRRVCESWTMATDGAALVENRVGITFDVELYVPWAAPEAVVDIQLESVVPLRSIPDVIGLAGRRSDAAESGILQGRDILVPDPRGLDWNFHDVTIVDMGDVPESSVSIPELLSLRQQWPPVVISHMGWLQQELEGTRAEAKQRFRQTRLVAFTAAHGLNAKCIGMWQSFTWTWHNCVGVRCLGAQCGKAHHGIAWIIFGGRMMFRGTLSRPTLNSFFRRGQFDVRIP